MMTTALWLLLYGGALAWLAPPVLRRMTAKPSAQRQMEITSCDMFP